MAEDIRSVQVLNISNVNAEGKTVLNDGKLLNLILHYPFLYNCRVKAHKDPDYTEWAWKRINASFNRSYENDPDAGFSTSDLHRRWEALKPLIQCLSKAYDLEAIPPSLRQAVIKISVQLEDQNVRPHKKSNNPLQNYLQEQMSQIAELPLEDRLALELEMIDLILSEELSLRATLKMQDAERQDVSKETEEFLREIGFRQVFDLAYSQERKMNELGTNNRLLEKADSPEKHKSIPKWIPLTEAKKHLKSCRVKVKRVNMEDYMPLSKMKKFKN
uniref:MADF domain-containing protein n=1 Tax=Glossina pallidipes TaxID=7398 RepID=A0A1A9ZVK1_GLOPL